MEMILSTRPCCNLPLLVPAYTDLRLERLGWVVLGLGKASRVSLTNYVLDPLAVVIIDLQLYC